MSSRYCLVGQFNEQIWQSSGLCWGASLQMASFRGEVIIVDTGLRQRTVATMQKQGWQVVPLQRHLFQTVAMLPEGIYAYWDASCYFQNNIVDIFRKSKQTLSFCRGHKPLMDQQNTLATFGCQPDICSDPEAYVGILKSLSRQYGTPPSDSFLAAPSDLWKRLAEHTTVLMDLEFLRVPCLAVFVRSFEGSCQLVDDEWCQQAGHDLTWDNGFHKNGQKVRALTVSEPSSPFDFRRRFPQLYHPWVKRWRGCPAVERRIVKGKKRGRRDN